MTPTTDDPRELLAALRDVEPTDAEIARARAAARARPASRAAARPPLLRSRRVVLVAAVALAAGAVTAVLPGDERSGTTALSALEAAAAAAADQPAPAPFTGYRHVDMLYRLHQHWGIPSDECAARQRRAAERQMEDLKAGRTPGVPGVRCEPVSSVRFVEESRMELWVDAANDGVRRDHGSRVVAASGDPAAVADVRRDMGREPATIRYVYGDGPFQKVPVRDLPTDPDALLAQLRAAYEDGRWTPRPEGHRPPATRPQADRDFELAIFTVDLITTLNVTPELRAAGFGVLARMPGFKDLGEVRDERGRSGHGIELHTTVTDVRGGPDSTDRTPARLRVIFDEDAGEILQWSHLTGEGRDASGREMVLLGTDHVSEIPPSVRASMKEA